MQENKSFTRGKKESSESTFMFINLHALVKFMKYIVRKFHSKRYMRMFKQMTLGCIAEVLFCVAES